MKLTNLKVLFLLLFLFIFVIGEVGSVVADTGEISNQILSTLSLKLTPIRFTTTPNTFIVLDDFYVVARGADTTTSCDGVSNFYFYWLNNGITLSHYTMSTDSCGTKCGEHTNYFINDGWAKQCGTSYVGSTQGTIDTNNLIDYLSSETYSKLISYDSKHNKILFNLVDSCSLDRTNSMYSYFDGASFNFVSGSVPKIGVVYDDDWLEDSIGYIGPVDFKCILSTKQLTNLNLYTPQQIKLPYLCNDNVLTMMFSTFEICSDTECKTFDSTTTLLEMESSKGSIVIQNPNYYLSCNSNNKFGQLEACYGEIIDGEAYCYGVGETSCSDEIDNDGDGKTDCNDEECYSYYDCESKEICDYHGGSWNSDLNQCCGDDDLTKGYEKPFNELNLQTGNVQTAEIKKVGDEGYSGIFDNYLEITKTDGASTTGVYNNFYDSLVSDVRTYVLSGFLKSSHEDSIGKLAVYEYDDGDLYNSFESITPSLSNWNFGILKFYINETNLYDTIRAYPIYFSNIFGTPYYSDEAYLIPYSDMGKADSNAQKMCTYIEPTLDNKNWEWTTAESSAFEIYPIGWTIDAISNGENWYYCNADGLGILNQGSLDGPIAISEYETFDAPSQNYVGKYLCKDYLPTYSGCTQYNGSDFRIGHFCEDCEMIFECSGIPDTCQQSSNEYNNPACCLDNSCTDNFVCYNPSPDDDNPNYWDCVENPSECVGTIGGGDDNLICADISNSYGLCNIEDYVCVGGEFVYSLDSNSATNPNKYCCVGGVCAEPQILSCEQDLGGYLCDMTEGASCNGGIINSQDSTDSTVCCNIECDIDPTIFQIENIEYSFICYEEDGRNLIAECTSGSLYNTNRQSLAYINGIYKDNSVFTTGNSLYSVFTNDIVDEDSNVLIDRVKRITDLSSSNEYYLDGRVDGEILMTTSNSNWTNFDYLEFGLLFNNPSINMYLIYDDNTEEDLGNPTDYAIDKFTKLNSGFLHHISMPLDNLEQKLKEKRVTNIKFENAAGIPITFVIDKLKLTEVDDSNKPINNYYCSGQFGQWIEGLNPNLPEDASFEEYGPYMVACESNFGFDWTGTQCCGYESSYGDAEYYNDIWGGCWAGVPVENDQTVSNATNQKTYYSNELFYDKEFRACVSDADITNIDDGNVALACEIQGSHYCSYDGSWEKIFSGTKLGVYYVDETGTLQTRSISSKCAPPGWSWDENGENDAKRILISEICSNEISWDTSLTNIIPTNEDRAEGTEQGCCPDEYCWDGTQCVSSNDYLDADSEPIWWDGEEVGYRCVLNDAGIANWELSYQKESYDETEFGWCPGETCYYSSTNDPQCVQPGFYEAEPYCLGGITGNWTKRVFMIAEELLNLTDTGDYSIYCGNTSDAVNYYDIIGENNKICVLNTKSNTILGTSLNENYSSDFKYTLQNYGINASCEDKEDYEACDLDEYNNKPTDTKYNIYYDNQTKIIFISEKEIILNPNWLQTFWYNLINLFKTKNPEVTNFKYENFYHIQEGDKSINAIYKPGQYIQIEYVGFAQDTISSICEKINEETGDTCINETGKATIYAEANQLILEWIELTSKTRIQDITNSQQQTK